MGDHVERNTKKKNSNAMNVMSLPPYDDTKHKYTFFHTVDIQYSSGILNIYIVDSKFNKFSLNNIPHTNLITRLNISDHITVNTIIYWQIWNWNESGH